MKAQTILRRTGWTAAGAAAALVIAACASGIDSPERRTAPEQPTTGPVPASAPVPAQRSQPQQVVVTGSRMPAPEAVPVESPAGASSTAPAGAAKASPGPAEAPTENIVVTGARIEQRDFTAGSPVDTVAGGAESSGSAQQASSLEELLEAVQSGTSSATQAHTQRVEEFRRASETGQLEELRARQAIERAQLQPSVQRFAGFAGSNRADQSALGSVQPGEEVWIISQPPPSQEVLAAAEQDALGSGVMIARLTTVVVDTVKPAPTVREIPLPLKHTDVGALVQGYVGTVDVTQQFENPYNEKIEAVYLFPLPEKAAVSEFVMTIGERRIRGILREKEEAQAIYREARAKGYQASLLTQHRPNVFEQKVANIEPGRQIDVNIRYYQTLAYADGWYSFVFPTVVGPRYNPPGSKDPLLALPESNFQPTPDNAVRYLTPGTRSAHDISISVELDAGVEIEEITSSHALATTHAADDVVRVELADGAAIPNQDFRLSFRVAGDRIKSNLLTYVDEESGQGYFTMMMYPPAGLENLERQPLELVFVLDCSGSMNGAPIEQAKDAIIAALDRLEPADTFQIIRFSQSASQFGRRPLAATQDNIRAARRYVRGLSGSGGTQMIEGIRAALGFPHDDERLRFVTFLTDGFIGNEVEILDAIDSSLGASRIFSFGVGSSPNRYLLERMAGIGRGAVAYLSLTDSGGNIMNSFFDRVAHPAMIDVAVDWGRMTVADVYPSRLPDLFVGRPVILTGRFQGEPNDVRMVGRAAGRRVNVRLESDDDAPEHAFLPNLWARLKIADLNDRLAVGPEQASVLGRQIRETALAYQLMSDYTSFVAVDASEVTEGSHGTTIFQAVPVPDGVRYDTTVSR